MAVFVFVLDRLVAVLMGMRGFHRDRHTDRRDCHRHELHGADGLLECPQSITAQMNCAVAKITCPRAAPRSRVPFTHSTMDCPITWCADQRRGTDLGRRRHNHRPAPHLVIATSGWRRDSHSGHFVHRDGETGQCVGDGEDERAEQQQH